MKVLGIETSCDETAASVVEDGQKILSDVVASSMDLHVKYGGVVPEIAARSHIESIIPVINQALSDADCAWDDIDAIGVTYGAGLGGSLLVGVMTVRTLAIVHDKPLYACNHVLGHLYANFLTSETTPEFPCLGVIVSGGHSQLVLFRSYFDYEMLGVTQDDAIGEAFDKVAKILGLPYPGGPSVAKKALDGDPYAYQLPKARMSGKYDFSFSGLKTAVLRLAQSEIGVGVDFPSFELAGRLNEAQKANIAASFQRVACETIADKVKLACDEFAPKSVIVGGGVSASQELRRQLSNVVDFPIEFLPFNLCTDNGAMIAALASYQIKEGRPVADPYSLDISPSLVM